MRVLVYVLDDLKCIRQDLLQEVIKELENYLKVKFFVEKFFGNIPKDCYNQRRMQYNAERLLSFVKYLNLNYDKVISLICEDIYVEGTNFVFGLAEINGKYCILSLRRLISINDELFKTRVFKEMLHELGHCFGLKHCANDCAMRFSNSLFEVDTKNKYLCEKCYNYIMLKLENLRNQT